MQDFIKKLFPLKRYRDPIARFRATATYTVSIALTLILLAVLPVTPSLTINDSIASASLVNLIVVFYSVLPFVALTAILLTRIGQQQLAGYLLLAVWLLPTWYLYVSAANQFDIMFGVAMNIMGITLGALLIGPNAVIIITAMTMVLTIPKTINAANNQVVRSPTALLGSFLLFNALYAIHAAVTYSLGRGLPATAQLMAERTAESRVKLAEASNAVTQQLLQLRLEMDALLQQTVQLVAGLMPEANAVQLYVTDSENRQATLSATTVPELSSLGQQIGVGTLNVVGRVTITGQPILVRETQEERSYRRETFLEGTRTQLVIPLRVGADVIGALDLQSKIDSAFSDEEIQTLETLTNQIAVVIDNARLYSDAQQQIKENQRLITQTRTSLREIERLNQQLTGSAWTDYLRNPINVPAYTINLVSGQIEGASEWTQTMDEASRRNHLTVRHDGNARLITLPISVRGQSIGAMEFELEPDQDIAAEQLAVLRQVIERLGYAVENSRLFEESQRAAQREALVSEISAHLQVATNVETVLASAIQSIADAFHSSRVSLRLGSPQFSIADTLSMQPPESMPVSEPIMAGKES